MKATAVRPIRLTIGLVGLVLVVGLSIGTVYAQLPGVSQEVIARGRLAYSDAVGGPADVYVGTIRIDPGSTYGGWHTHPGVVWVVVSSGDLAVYGPDGCRSAYTAGSAYVAEADTLYDLRNESGAPVELAFAGVIRAGQPATVFAEAPAAKC
jgi:Cupin domain